MRYGKLTEEELKKMLSGFMFSRSEIIKGAVMGADTAVVRCSDNILVTTDPITAYVENMGELAVDVNANDIYASGGEPFAATLTVLAPPNMTVDSVLYQIHAAHENAASKGIAIIGGHTEFTDAVNRLVISMTVLGRTKKLLDNRAIAKGDKVIVTKSIGIEGAKIILDNYRDILNELNVEDMCELQNLSVSVGLESIASQNVEIHAMHDVTEGGVAGACAEIVSNSPYGIVIYEKAIPISKAVYELCVRFELDPNYLISSGSMLIITPDAPHLLRAMEIVGVDATVIGEVIEGDSVMIKRNGYRQPLQVKTDEIYKFLNSLKTEDK